MQEGIQVLDELRLNFSPEGLFILNFTLFIIMLGVALDIKVSHIKEVFANPKPAIIGYCCQFFLLPAITFLLIWTLKDYLSPGVALGMILMAACPGGNISNFFSALAKGNPALSISLTALATLSASSRDQQWIKHANQYRVRPQLLMHFYENEYSGVLNNQQLEI